MQYQSRLSRVQETRAKKRIIISVALLIFFVIFAFVAGVPLLSRLSLLLTNNADTGNTSQDQSKLPLLAPRFEPIVEATNTAQISISGFANEGETIKVYVNDEEKEKLIIGKDGTFEVRDIDLIEGDNTIYAKVTKGTKESPPTDLVKIVYKKTPPKLEVSDPSEGQTFLGDSNKSMNLKGKTEPEVNITINDRITLVSSDGSFTYRTDLHDGDNEFKVVATDTAGNQTTLTRKVTYKP